MILYNWCFSRFIHSLISVVAVRGYRFMSFKNIIREVDGLRGNRHPGMVTAETGNKRRYYGAWLASSKSIVYIASINIIVKVESKCVILQSPFVPLERALYCRGGACPNVTDLRNWPMLLRVHYRTLSPVASKLQTSTNCETAFIRLLTETEECGGRLPLVPHS